MSRVDDFIAHYASQYYDPAKAHDYYIKTRQLKGRTTNGMSDAQKEAWGYTKKQITDEKNGKIDDLRNKAQEARQQLSAKIANKLASIDSKAERDRIANELKAAIESVRTEYEKIFDTEYDNIKANIKGKAPKKPKSKKKSEPAVNWDTFDKT